MRPENSSYFTEINKNKYLFNKESTFPYVIYLQEYFQK